MDAMEPPPCSEPLFRSRPRLEEKEKVALGSLARSEIAREEEISDQREKVVLGLVACWLAFRSG